MMERKRNTLAYLLAVLMFGCLGLLLRLISLPSDIVVLSRCILGSLFVLLLMKLRGHRMDKAAIRKNGKWLVISGACMGWNWLLLFAAYRYTTVAIASLCNYVAPILVIFAAAFLFREKLSRIKMLCVAGALAGIVLVSGVIEGAELPPDSPKGILFALLAALGFAAVVLCNRKMSEIDDLDKCVMQLLSATVAVLPFVLYSNWGKPLQPDLQSILLTVLIGLVFTGGAYCLYFSALGTLPVQSIAILGYLEPVISVLCSVLILREPITALGIIGAVLTVGSAAASELIRE